MRLKDKVVIVTGASSSGPGIGIGRATAILFAKEGAKVIAVGRRSDALQDTITMIEKEDGQAIAMPADITNDAEIEDLIKTTISQYGTVDILFNNVGIDLGPSGLNITGEEWDTVMNTNLKSALTICKYVVPVMIKNSGGVIVNNSSLAAYYPGPGYAYCASKAGLNALTRSLASELGKYNIRVNCVAPGMIDTPMIQPIKNKTKRFRPEFIRERVPLGRLGKAEEVARTVLFLVSDDSSFVTGQTILVDGGRSIR